VSLATPHGVKRVDVRGAVAMRGALWQASGVDLARVDALVMAAAVADYRAAEVSASKIKKAGEHATIELVKNPDLLAEIGEARAGKKPVLVGFAVETDGGQGLVAYAKQKLAAKKVDFVVANDAKDAFAGDGNKATIVSNDATLPLPQMSKHALADVVLDRVKALASR
jgi:phosphopantothenoylcysteine decarboxylase/phosphopantothenate--cysteine ligase